MKTIVLRQFDRFFHRPSGVRFESRALFLDGAAPTMHGVAVVEDAAAATHFSDASQYLVFEGRHELLGATVRSPVAVSTADAVAPTRPAEAPIAAPVAPAAAAPAKKK